MGFHGAVVSDYLRDRRAAEYASHRRQPRGGRATGARAGVDVDLPNGADYATLDSAGARRHACRRSASTRRCAALLTLKFRAGLFENPYADPVKADALTGNAEARALALKAAQRTIMLLKNDGMLPLACPLPGRQGRHRGDRPECRRGSGSAAITASRRSDVSILDGIRAKVGRAQRRHSPKA
jgi:beta-glucosidase